MASVVTLLVGVLIGPLSGAGPIPSPFAPTSSVRGYFVAHSTTTAVSAWFVLLSAIALGVFAAVTCSRLMFLTPNAPGPLLAGFGGLAAAMLLAVSAAITWVLSRAEVLTDPSLVHGLHYLSFVAGGPAHTVALGVMTLGLAVTSLFVRRTPRWLAMLGIVIAAIDLLTSVCLPISAAAPLVPVGRFTTLAWVIVFSLLLPRSRGARGGAVGRPDPDGVA